MPNIPAGAKTTDLSAQAAMMRTGAWGRIKAAVRYAIAGVAPDTWMSPSQPVEPVAQQVYGRNRDYPVGYNLRYTPRAEELSSFAQLRMLADNCDLVRLAIETRKDQMAALQWGIAHVDPDKDVAEDARAKRITQLFRSPDGELDWDTWLRMLLEDVLVIDAPAILPRRLNSGALYGFEIIDGATIKPLVDDRGRRPLPPSPAYQQIIKGLPAVDYTAEELIYRPRNPRSHKFYGYSPVEQILLTVNIAIRRGVSQLQHYTEGNIPAMFASVPKEWTPQQIEQFQQYWDSVIEGDQAYKRKARFVPGDTKVTHLTEAPLKDEFDEWLARVVCYAFSLPPTAFVREMNRATSETHQETANKEGLGPLMRWVKRLMDHLIQTYLDAPDLEFRWLEEDATEPQAQAEILTLYQRTGIYSINEIRAKLGEDPITEEGGDLHLIITGSGATPLEQAIKPPQPPPQFGKPGEGGAPEGGDTPDETPPAGEKVAKAAGDPEHAHGGHTEPPMTAHEKRLRDSFAAALDVVRDAALDQLAAMSKATGDGDGSRDSGRWQNPKEWAAEYVGSMDMSGMSLVWDDYTDTLEIVSSDGARTAVARIVADDPSVEAAARAAGFGLLDHQDPNAIEWARKHAAEMLTRDGAGGELAESTREMIRQTIETALRNHATNEQLAEALRDAYAFSEQRAELIARTEVANALGAGGLAGAKSVGMEEKSWLLSNDENKCQLCIANAEQGWIPIDDAYVSGAMAPGQHPRCQCDQVYRKRPKEE